jgi:hypothetical protein
MIDQWLAALEATWLARSLRDSVWIYPLVNTGHIAGIALLVGSIIPLDLRLLSLWQSWPLAPLWHVLTRTATAGLIMAILFGSLLFVARATEYAASPFFLAKMIVVGAAVLNALALRVALPRPASKTQPPVEARSWRIRVAAGFSLIAWLAALTLGRLVGYF